MTRFAFLPTDFPDLLGHARKAEQAALPDPRGSCFYARLTLKLRHDNLPSSQEVIGGCLAVYTGRWCGCAGRTASSKMLNKPVLLILT